MTHFECVYALRELLARPGTRLLCLDAAADFTMSDTELRSVVQDGLRLLAPQRSVIHLSLQPSNMPAHLRRDLRVYFGMDQTQLMAWVRQLDGAITEWRAASERGERGLIILAVGTPSFARKVVIPYLRQRGVSFSFYHGESDQKLRFRDFKNPMLHWAGICCLITTTVLGRGVDLPQGLNVSRVFVAFHRMGCNFPDLFQTLVRARHVEQHTIEALLLVCMSPEEHQHLVRMKKRKAIVRPTYEQALQWQRSRRGISMVWSERQAQASATANDTLPASDQLLRVMAHETLNRRMQVQDPMYAVARLAKYYGFAINHAPGTTGPLAEAWAMEQYSQDTLFDFLTKPLEKWERVVEVIRERGEEGFFNDKCWGLATDAQRKGGNPNCLDHFLVKAFHALAHLGELPEAPNLEAPDDMGLPPGAGPVAPVAPAEAEADAEAVDPAATLLFDLLGNGKDHMDQTKALSLQAHCRLFTPAQQMQADSAARLELRLTRQGAPATVHPHCELGMGQKMAVVQTLLCVLLRRELAHMRQAFAPNGGLVGNAHPELIAAANRSLLAKANNAAPTPADAALLKELQGFKEQLGASGKHSTLIDVLRSIAIAIGLRAECQYVRHRVGGRDAKKRISILRDVDGLCFHRFLPAEVAGWLVWSPSLSAMVRVSDWDGAHVEQQADLAEAVATSSDPDYGDMFSARFERPAGADMTTNTRVEKIDAVALQDQLARLQQENDRFAWRGRASAAERSTWGSAGEAAYDRHLQTVAHLQAARAIDGAADAANEHGVRRLVVIYGKNSLDLGRRTASSPSMQHCPSALRLALCCARYHDVTL